MEIICRNPLCNNTFIRKRRQIYCSGKCNRRMYYVRNQKVMIEKVKKWSKANPEKVKMYGKKSSIKFRTENRVRFNELVRNDYIKNKDKWYCRSLTNKILNGTGGYKKYNPLQKECKCGSVENLEIHHEEYPMKMTEIKKAINDGLIYYKCRSCHGRKINHKLNKDSKYEVCSIL